jgi:hypothetical protein
MTDLTGIEPNMATVGPPLPGYDYLGMWRTGPPTELIAIEVWGRKATRAAIPRIISDAASETPRAMNAGTASAGGTDACRVLWTAEARRTFAEAWLDSAEAETIRLLANRWGTV